MDSKAGNESQERGKQQDVFDIKDSINSNCEKKDEITPQPVSHPITDSSPSSLHFSSYLLSSFSPIMSHVLSLFFLSSINRVQCRWDSSELWVAWRWIGGREVVNEGFRKDSKKMVIGKEDSLSERLVGHYHQRSHDQDDAFPYRHSPHVGL
ncbi:hypothetical protein ADUPG1_003622, partial [Aduncisulcus paluster]